MFLTKQSQTGNALCGDVLISGLFSGYKHDFGGGNVGVLK